MAKAGKKSWLREAEMFLAYASAEEGRPSTHGKRKMPSKREIEANIAAFAGKRIHEPRKGGPLVECKVCGMMAKPGILHYPWNDKDRGPKHKP